MELRALLLCLEVLSQFDGHFLLPASSNRKGGLEGVNFRQLFWGKQKHEKEYLENGWEVTMGGKVSCLNKEHT